MNERKTYAIDVNRLGYLLALRVTAANQQHRSQAVTGADAQAARSPKRLR